LKVTSSEFRTALEQTIRADAEPWAGPSGMLKLDVPAHLGDAFRHIYVRELAREMESRGLTKSRLTVDAMVDFAAKAYAPLLTAPALGPEELAEFAPVRSLGWAAECAYEEAAVRSARDLPSWRQLPLQLRDKVLDIFSVKHPHLTVVRASSINELKTDAQRTFAKSMFKHVERTFDLTVPDESYATVGPPQVGFELVVLPSGEVAGGTIRIEQEGATHPEGAAGHFDTPQQAQAAGLEVDADVSWGAWARFDSDGTVLAEQSTLEWTGP
jgi:hypothetical protein